MRLSIRSHKPPLLLYHTDHYRLWVSYTADLHSGSYYHLQTDGLVDLVTVKDQEIVDIIRIRDHGPDRTRSSQGMATD